MRLIDADALEKEGWSLHRTIRVDANTSEYQTKPIKSIPTAQPETDGFCTDCKEYDQERHCCPRFDRVIKKTVEEMQIIHCKDCKHWKRQTNYQNVPLSFGFCESDDMWRSLYGETYEVSHIDTDDDFYCGYAERREDG